VRPDVLLRVLCGQFKVEVVQAIIAQQVQHEGEQRHQLPAHLLLRAVDMASSCVMPRTRIRPWTTPDFSNRYTVPNSNSRNGSSPYERPRDRKIRLWNGQFIGLR